MFSMQEGCGEAVPCSRAQPGLKDAEAVKRRWCQRSVLRAQQASPQLCKYMRSLAGRKGEASGVWAVPLFTVFPPCACRDHSISHRGHPTPHPAPGLTITAPPGASNHCKKHCCNFFIEAFCGILFFVSFLFSLFLDLCSWGSSPEHPELLLCHWNHDTETSVLSLGLHVPPWDWKEANCSSKWERKPTQRPFVCYRRPFQIYKMS